MVIRLFFFQGGENTLGITEDVPDQSAANQPRARYLNPIKAKGRPGEAFDMIPCAKSCITRSKP